MRGRSILVAFALLASMAFPAAAQAPMHASVEGGLSCSRNKSIVDPSLNGKIGDNGCGWTGAVEIGRTGAPVFSIFDHWAVRGRYTTFDDTLNYAAGATGVRQTMDDRRIVLDAEVGTKFNLFSFFGGESRIVFGLRYASWRGELDAVGISGPGLGISESSHLATVAFGPRIGLRSSIPLGTHWMIESRSGIAALYGRHEFSFLFNGVTVGTIKDDNWVFNLESNTALSYKLNGTEAGPVVSVGLFSEYWFNQTNVAGSDADRHSWGPFARVRMPIQ